MLEGREEVPNHIAEVSTNTKGDMQERMVVKPRNKGKGLHSCASRVRKFRAYIVEQN
jgi:hypothetical protein